VKFLLVPAQPGNSKRRAIKWLLLLLNVKTDAEALFNKVSHDSHDKTICATDSSSKA